MEHCHQHPEPNPKTTSCCQHGKKNLDWLLWGSLIIVGIGYLAHLLATGSLTNAYAEVFSKSVFELLNRMSWGILLGIIFVGILNKVPREFVTSLLGKGGTFSGILRATGAGVLLDLCSHGILMVGMKLYERGASLGQIMAFLIASPWNSLSLTLILWALVGFKWMISFLLLSMLIAIISGLIFEKLVRNKVLPPNPNQTVLPQNFRFWREAKSGFNRTKFNGSFFGRILIEGVTGSKMVLKWIFFGIVLAALIRTFMTPESFEALFGPTIAGLGLTLFVATILEVCSEGSTPIAADLLTRAGAPGNSFAFLMTGVSTDYTEMMSLKETTKSWKIALFLPLVTLPQVIILALLLNQML
ncbi:permease [Candidatus Gracilibacteria bacterium]|nr:permease [Candidatus Gracilibacteria bacterium]